ncbi:reverse transcriptase domain-containing protein [Tanacetum coccineum]
MNITQRFASVEHPQSNGLVEIVNRSLGEGIKACLGEGNKNWIEELPHVLWAHRTMIKSSHGDTPFSLTYGTEAVIPAEIGMPTYHIAVVDVVHNNEELRLNLDLLEERRDSNEASHAMDGGNLGPKWEGPYEVTEALGDGAYMLRLSTLIIACREAMKWIAVVSDVVPLLCHPPQSMWRHPLTKSLAHWEQDLWWSIGTRCQGYIGGFGFGYSCITKILSAFQFVKTVMGWKSLYFDQVDNNTPRTLIPLRPPFGVLRLSHQEPRTLLLVVCINNYDNESSDDDNDDDDFKKDEEDEEEEEHLALVDPSALPTDDPVPSS